jgi:hypothetical protein
MSVLPQITYGNVALIFLSYFHGYNKNENCIYSVTNNYLCRFISSTKKKMEQFYLIFLLNNVLVSCSANFGAPGIVYLKKLLLWCIYSVLSLRHPAARQFCRSTYTSLC